MSDDHAIQIVELNDAAVRTDRAGCDAGMTPGDQNDAVILCLNQVSRLLRKAPEESTAETSPHTIFRIPPPLRGIIPEAVEPEVVSIGPYHRGRPQVLAFEKLKLLFLGNFLCRNHLDLEPLTRAVANQESSVRTLYSEHVDMTRADFVQMMLLDGCFVVELLLHIYMGDDATRNDPIFSRPQIIPSLIGDLLKLENQIPFFLLQKLFDASGSKKLMGETDNLVTAALNLFDLAYPRPKAHHRYCREEPKHLLDLFYSSLYPTLRVYPNHTESAQSVPRVTELMPSGIKFKSNKAYSFLDIRFGKPVRRKPYMVIVDFMARVLKNPVLQIPDIAINDFMTTVLINCVSLEQCRESRFKYMTDYIYFMHCLIKQPKDVSLLRSDGIIAPFSHDDQYVADLFDKLGKSISFNVHGCFLSELFGELDKYYRSNWANMMRTYFSSPWSSISAFTAFLIIVFTITQTVFAILTYCFRR